MHLKNTWYIHKFSCLHFLMTEAFKDYTKVNLKKSQVKQSIRKKLSKAMEAVKNLKQREKVKTKDYQRYHFLIDFILHEFPPFQ